MAVRNVPIALPSIRPLDCPFVCAPEFPQRRIFCPNQFPSLPQQLSDSSPNPLVRRFRPRFVFREFEIFAPPTKLLVKHLFHHWDTLLSVSGKYFSQRILEPLLRLRVHDWKVSVLGFIEPMSKKLHSVRDVADSGLRLIDFEFHASFDESSDALQRPLGRSLGFA